jgi:hypothetical protein
MKALWYRRAAAALALPALAAAFPPGAPMSEFGPSQVSLSLFFDHSGQDLFDAMYPSVMNTGGVSLDYAPWPFVQAGIFGGATEFDVALPDSRLSDTSAHSFNTDYSMSGGASLKLATPRVASGTTRLVGFGAATYYDNKDNPGNEKRGLVYNAGATIQCMIANRLNLVLGGEFYQLTGEQTSAAGGPTVDFSNSQPDGIVDLGRGIVGVEWFFQGKNRPFISVSFRPTGSLGWHDQLGLRGGSISVALGAMATLGKKLPDAGEDEPGMADEP